MMGCDKRASQCLSCALATALEALDKAEAERDALREGLVKAERTMRLAHERMQKFAKADIGIHGGACPKYGEQELREGLKAIRTLIQPEPDPFAVAIAEANESYLAGTGDLADHIREALARHGLAVKEVG